MPKNILFVCVKDVRKSSMAESFFRKFTLKQFNVSSVGVVVPLMQQQLYLIILYVIKEIIIDTSSQKPKVSSHFMIENSFTTTNLGCMDKKLCFLLFVKDVLLDWNTTNPKEKIISTLRIICNKIKSKVLNLIKSLEE